MKDFRHSCGGRRSDIAWLLENVIDRVVDGGNICSWDTPLSAETWPKIHGALVADVKNYLAANQLEAVEQTGLAYLQKQGDMSAQAGALFILNEYRDHPPG